MPTGFAPFSNLSQELVEEIVDALVDTQESDLHISNLCACALVCRSFRHRAQKYIFYSMTLLGLKTEANCRERVDSFHEILQKNPRIASYIRRLRFDMDDTAKWVFEDPLLLQIMELVTKTWVVGTKLELSIFAWSEDFHFTDNRTFETRFVKPFVTPFITSLDLHYVYDVPLTLFSHCPHLVDLSLIWVTVEASPRFNVIAVDQSLRSRPHKFTFQSLDSSFRALSATCIDFSHLQYLSASGYLSDEIPDLNFILEASSSSLKCLELEFDELEGHLSTVWDLSRIPNLTQLTLSMVNLDTVDDEDPFADLCNLLRTTCSEKTKINTIALGFMGKLDASWKLSAYLEKLETGRPLSTVLAKIAEKKPLEVKIRLDLTAEAERIEELETWIADNSRLMRKLSPNVSQEYDYKLH
ncbi:hypothetical protein GALMADRAFT_559331 [Galerina marginata CBS 339.88]|uniref:F-box domain-containing protein n=1 Tax=Galerina marginata (strain CBS 339.88) TaxID=685588 RepID=A0A067T3Y4_GALM3|nr:hypothetical protein GALMADRAFT_559331 [Galerina marginata CBS 339.88]